MIQPNLTAQLGNIVTRIYQTRDTRTRGGQLRAPPGWTAGSFRFTALRARVWVCAQTPPTVRFTFPELQGPRLRLSEQWGLGRGRAKKLFKRKNKVKLIKTFLLQSK